MNANIRRPPALRARGFSHLIPCAALLILGACTFTVPEGPSSLRAPPPPTAVNQLALDQYREAVARRIVERNPSYVLKQSPQAMLRSLVVVAYTVDRNGALVSSSVYRTNGDDEAEATALATLRHAAPLPPPPPELLNRDGEMEMMEDWLFNDNCKFQLRTLAQPQAQALE